MSISDPSVIEAYQALHEKNKQLIIKKNVLNQLLLKGPQSEAIRMVLDKVASGGLKVEEEQKKFVTMLKNNNYDINKIIDDYVKKLNTKMVDQKAKQASEEGVTPGQASTDSVEASEQDTTDPVNPSEQASVNPSVEASGQASTDPVKPSGQAQPETGQAQPETGQASVNPSVEASTDSVEASEEGVTPDKKSQSTEFN